MAQPAIKRTQSDANQAETLPSFLAPPTVDTNQTETFPEQVDDPNLPVSNQEASKPLSDVDDHAMIVKEQINRLDMERLRVAAQLVNTFNHAIQVQAGRTDWNEHDYAAFIVALRSVDRIGYDAQQAVKK